MREETALENAGNSVDQYIQLGREALGELYQQRSMLKVNDAYSEYPKTVTGHWFKTRIVSKRHEIY